MNSLNRWICAFVVALCAILVLPELMKEGMFYDGLIYSTISRNLAFEYGSFWKPMYTPNIWPEFYGHPPLVFAIQSLFFQVLGNGLFIERIFTMLTFVISAFFIIKIWQHIQAENKPQAQLIWLPILLWILAPSVDMTYARNMLENSVSCFTLASVYLMMIGFDRKSPWLYYLLAGILCYAAFLSKGFVGLFPWALPFLYYVSTRKPRPKSLIISSFTIIGTSLICVALTMIDEEARNSLLSYLDLQVIASIEGRTRLAPLGRLHLLIKIISEIFYMILVVGVFYLAAKKIPPRFRIKSPEKQLILFFVLLGVSASFPIMISQKQAAYYAVPAYPYFALAAAILGARLWVKITADLARSLRIKKVLITLTILAFGVAIGINIHFSSMSRSKAMLTK